MSQNNLLPLLLLGGVAYFVLRSQKDTSPVPSVPVPSGDVFPLRRGSQGAAVRQLQIALLQRGGTVAMALRETGGVDGRFGLGTERALQRAGFPVVVDQNNFRRLMEKQPGPDASRPDTGRPDTGQPALGHYLYAGPNGASVYKKVNTITLPLIGDTHLGGQPLVKVFYKTYLGKATGQRKGDFWEVKAVLNGLPVRFWVDTDETKTLTGTPEAFKAFQQSHLLAKKPEHIQRILNAFS
ncbi:hypothetical protein AAG747_14040 [Rapidithrix thailandica]|uniref:Uncharacterized protein n=1 Tax=Rapidithrix thailandica TaxID=413964 RepID=A0AAW9S1I8_9BACT